MYIHVRVRNNLEISFNIFCPKVAHRLHCVYTVSVLLARIVDRKWTKWVCGLQTTCLQSDVTMAYSHTCTYTHAHAHKHTATLWQGLSPWPWIWRRTWSPLHWEMTALQTVWGKWNTTCKKKRWILQHTLPASKIRPCLCNYYIYMYMYIRITYLHVHVSYTCA